MISDLLKFLLAIIGVFFDKRAEYEAKKKKFVASEDELLAIAVEAAQKIRRESMSDHERAMDLEDQADKEIKSLSDKEGSS